MSATSAASGASAPPSSATRSPTLELYATSSAYDSARYAALTALAPARPSVAAAMARSDTRSPRSSGGLLALRKGPESWHGLDGTVCCQPGNRSAATHSRNAAAAVLVLQGRDSLEAVAHTQ